MCDGFDVSPDMMRAGVEAFERWNPDEEEVEAVVAAVFFAMWEVVKKQIMLRNLTQ
jgi:hypothetical protein